MNTQDIIKTIKSLTIKSAGAAYTSKTNDAIAAAAATLAPLLASKNLKISKGSSSPTTQRSYQRIYLEPIDSTTHDSRHAAYKVIATWEWQTQDKYGYHPISQLQIRQLVGELISTVEAYN